MRITSTAESIVRSGHPWLFADSIREQTRTGSPGELAVIYDRQDRFLAVGLFDPESPIRVRILHTGKPVTIDDDWWTARLDDAIKRRCGLFDERTTGHRWINGESDGWPGLVLDRYDTTLVLKLYTAAWLPRLEEVVGLINQRLPNERSVLRLSRNVSVTAVNQFKLSDGQILSGSPLMTPVCFLENGLRFEADVLRGQKTGFFLDQRENRRQIEALASGRRVLNAFSFSGGFSLYAARGGARSVIDLDISPHALASAKRNFRLNLTDQVVAACRHETVQADAFEWLQVSRAQFDLVVLDPPSFAKSESERTAALNAYRRLTKLGIEHLTDKGILLAASCSAHVTAEEFFEVVRESAAKSGRKFVELQTMGHPPDHPATFKEAEYLKAIYLKFENLRRSPSPARRAGLQKC
ncbi:MAG: class I SAM-dependent methyltransferase [Verrucomicrobia bacterium]|nr:class I SAM-dependent methyltransferase [Verrucomicrobiota bacterium]